MELLQIIVGDPRCAIGSKDTPSPRVGLWARVFHRGGGHKAGWVPRLGSPLALVPLTKLGSRTVISLTSRKLKLL